MQLLAQDLARAYRQSHSYATVEVRGGNSSSGLVEYERGSLDIALVSKNPTSEELKRPPSRAIEIAHDGIVIIVHNSNTLENVSRDQLAKIFSGEILSWSQLSGKPSKGGDDSIQVTSREDGSGTRSVFEQSIMAGRRVTLTALVQPSSRDMLDYVKSSPNAIGYVAFNLWKGNSTTRAISIDGIAPSSSAIQASTYPLMQRYYLVAPIDASPAVSDFIDFVLSASAHELISARVSASK